MPSFILGSSKSSRVAVTVHRYERQASGDYHDDNWVACSVEVGAGAFQGRFDASFLTEEFVAFQDQLRQLHEQLKGKACFETLEQQLSIGVVAQGLGGISVSGEAADYPGIGNRLRFHFELDQTYLAEAIGGLDEIIRAFPVRVA